MIRTILNAVLAVALAASAGPVVTTIPAQGQNAPSTPTPSKPATDANSGRRQLDKYLDDIASRDEAVRTAKVAAIHTLAEAEARQAEVRKEIQSLIGPLPERTPLDAQVIGETQADGFRIRKVVYESQPGFPVTALVYLPGDKSEGQKHAAILLTPGHQQSGKVSDAAMAALFALNGFVVLSYDPIGEGERLQYPDPAKPATSMLTGPTGEHGEASLQPMLIGDSFARYELWDAMRGIDYLEGLPEVDAKRIGAMGCSGGGTVTALVGALDPRVAAVGVACYITSFDTLLPSMGPQDAEQSIPNFISSGLGFPDWIELAAPRPYAVISTYQDMFSYDGARDTVVEARRFYSIFDPESAGTTWGAIPQSVPRTPYGPALDADTTNHISPSAKLQFITGPGGHGALKPIMASILSFFIRNLQPGADPDGFVEPAAYLQMDANNPLNKIPNDAFIVTRTGQVATSFPNCKTVFTLNLKRAAEVISAKRPLLSGEKLADAIRELTGAAAKPGATKFDTNLLQAKSGAIVLLSDGIGLEGEIAVPRTPGRHPAVLLLTPDSIDGNSKIARRNKAKFEALASRGDVVLALTPRPSPPGTEEALSPQLGPFYRLSLRADLVGRTLVGLRTDDVIRAVDYLASRSDVDAVRISAVASGHEGLVLLHAAVLDRRLRHIAVDHELSSYRSLLNAPMPVDAAEDVVPGVLLRYDLGDVKSELGARLTETDAMQGSADLSQTATPLRPN